MSSLVLTIHNFGVPNFDPYLTGHADQTAQVQSQDRTAHETNEVLTPQRPSTSPRGGATRLLAPPKKVMPPSNTGISPIESVLAKY